jgi:hypothetical protein
MVRTVRWLGVSAVALLLVGCPKKPVASDAGSDAAPEAAAIVEAAAPPAANTGANDADVTKYPDQNGDNMEALTTRFTVNARTEASSTGGKLVAQLKAGAQAQRMADHEGFDLVLFSDPADATRKIEGWVAQSAFGTVPVVHHTADGGIAPPTPPATGFVCVKQNPPNKCRAGFVVSGAVCRVPCSSPADCHGPDPKCNEGKCYASNGCGD